MILGATFPQTEIGNDPGAIRAFAQAVEDLGYTFLACYDHVLGAHPDRAGTATAALGPLTGPYTHDHPFHEPFVLFGYLAALTERVELFTNVLVLPQRQTALAAKQAVEVDLLSGGRLRLGVAVGWNPVEYAALGQDFRTRGRRLDDQLELLEALWSGQVLERGGPEPVDRASLNPPAQHPIPLWFGGGTEATLRRTARHGAGWMPNVLDLGRVRALRARLDELAAEAGRDPSAIGQYGVAFTEGCDEEAWRARLVDLAGAGYTHATITTMRAGLTSVDDHIATAARFHQVALDALGPG